jgi:FK506-binding protein 1
MNFGISSIFKYAVVVFVIVFISCHKKEIRSIPSIYKGVEWHLISFEDTTKMFQKEDWLWLDIEFTTQSDSVFWSSHHEGADKFFIQLKDTLENPFFFPFYYAAEKDSFFIIAPKSLVLKDIFNITESPYFIKQDSVIKCFIKIKKKINPFTDKAILTFQQDEKKIIQNFLNKHRPLHQIDSNGIIWLEPLPIPSFKERLNVKEATVAYYGYFLDGRMIDFNDSLGIRYNDSLQLIEGLNYVIKRLDVGQSAKIVLPSPLAYGMRGSFNKTIPPFTPLLYEIKLLQLK